MPGAARTGFSAGNLEFHGTATRPNRRQNEKFLKRQKRLTCEKPSKHRGFQIAFTSCGMLVEFVECACAQRPGEDTGPYRLTLALHSRRGLA